MKIRACIIILVVFGLLGCSKDYCASYDLYVYYGEEITDSLMYHTTTVECWEDWELEDGRIFRKWTYVKDSTGHWLHDPAGKFINCLHLYIKQ